MKAKKIATTGNLREFLAQMLIDVKNGDIDLDKAGRITKIAAQINENLYAEVKVAKIRVEMGDTTPDLGALPIGEVKRLKAA